MTSGSLGVASGEINLKNSLNSFTTLASTLAAGPPNQSIKMENFWPQFPPNLGLTRLYFAGLFRLRQVHFCLRQV